jgi:hypothetical protein
MASDNLFNGLRIVILATDNQQILLPANHEQCTFETEPRSRGLVQAIDDRLSRKVGTIVVSLEEAVAFLIKIFKLRGRFVLVVRPIVAES